MGWRHIGATVVLVASCSSGPIVLGRLGLADGGSPREDGGAADGAAGGEAGLCEPPPPARRYPFDGTGTVITDTRGGPPGRLLGGATLPGTGVLRLDGVRDYVDLPHGVLAVLTEVTIALWVRRKGGPGYTRLFDFGTGSLGQDPPPNGMYVGTTYLAATPATGHALSGLAVLMSRAGAGGEGVATSTAVLDDAMRSVVVVVSSDKLSLFLEGALLARVPRPAPLSAIVVQNAWLGRSQYAADPYLAAEYADLRIFDVALSDCAVRTLHERGADAP